MLNNELESDDNTATMMIMCKLYPELTLKEAFEKLNDVDFLEKMLVDLEGEKTHV